MECTEVCAVTVSYTAVDCIVLLACWYRMWRLKMSTWQAAAVVKTKAGCLLSPSLPKSVSSSCRDYRQILLQC